MKIKLKLSPRLAHKLADLIDLEGDAELIGIATELRAKLMSTAPAVAPESDGAAADRRRLDRAARSRS